MSSLSNTEILKLLGHADQETHNAVEAKITECIEKIALKIPNHHTLRPKVLYDLKGNTAGYAIGGHTIRLNLDLLHNPETRTEMLEQTVPHELAHIVQRQIWPHSKSHGRQWKMLMHYMGLKADRCHEMPTKPARKTKRWSYSCENGCAAYSLSTQRHNKLQRNPRAYVCAHCRGSLTYNG